MVQLAIVRAFTHGTMGHGKCSHMVQWAMVRAFTNGTMGPGKSVHSWCNGPW